MTPPKEPTPAEQAAENRIRLSLQSGWMYLNPEVVYRELRAARAPLETRVAALSGELAQVQFELAGVRGARDTNAATIHRLADERDEVRSKLATVSAEWKEMSARLDVANENLRLVAAGIGCAWHWQGDGHDYPASLSCPVVMAPETLREFMASREELARVLAERDALRTEIVSLKTHDRSDLL